MFCQNPQGVSEGFQDEINPDRRLLNKLFPNIVVDVEAFSNKYLKLYPVKHKISDFLKQNSYGLYD